ncbi:hypothetical protein D3C71_1434360 [compost metagenome]
MVVLRHDFAAEVQPFLIVASQPQYRPVAAEDHAFAAEQFQNGFGIGPDGFRSLLATLGQQAGQLAMEVGKGRQSCHVPAPVAILARGDKRLRAVIDDNRQLRMAAREGEKMRQMRRQDQRIEHQCVFH